MHHEHFLNQVQDHAVAKAISDAEKKMTGRIRVFVSHHDVADPVAAAQHHFVRMRMDQTPERNAILIFVAPRSHKFAIIGDSGIHEKCGEAFWNKTAGEMAAYFKQENWTDALVHGIGKTGEVLAEYFPAQRGAAHRR
jgi:uncharacterized membrane protein